MHSRQRLGGKAIDLIDRKFWPRGLKFGRNWNNDEVSHILNKRLDSGLPEPFFLMSWYNCRGDPDTSAKVEKDFDRLRNMGLLDNSVFLLCSDHGYPDPSRGMGPQWFARQNLTHDLVLTDDNILVPLLIRYPGCQPRKVTVPVGTMDLMPTILDLLRISPRADESRRLQGHSLVPLMEGRPAPHLEERKFRSDARFMMQTHRRTSIRGSRFKYIVYHDEGGDELYDLHSDPSESHNLIDDTSFTEVLGEFRSEFKRSEQEAVEFHLRYLLERTQRLGSDLGGVKRALVIHSQPIPNSQLILKALASLLSKGTIDLMTSQPLDTEQVGSFSNVFQWPSTHNNGSPGEAVLPSDPYDVVILPAVEQSGSEFGLALSVARRLSRRYPLILDPNLGSLGEPRKTLSTRLRVAYQRKGLYLREPSLIIKDVRRALGRGRQLGPRQEEAPAPAQGSDVA